MKTAIIRPPAVAGMFYPASAYELQSDVEAFMSRGHIPRPAPKAKALIAPHAGYPYSGPIAGSAFKCLEGMHERISRVILFGPSHRVGFRGLALSGSDAFQTPLGEVEVDHDITRQCAGSDLIGINDRAHRDEHSLEVELPFLQCALDRFKIVPIVVGDATGEEVAMIMEALWNGPETLIVVSSDLSHYLTYEAAQKIDQRTTKAILDLAPENIEPQQACGRVPIQGLLIIAAKKHLKVAALDVRNSGDTAGDRHQVVGYGAYVFSS